jgi:hypothetical protein
MDDIYIHRLNEQELANRLAQLDAENTRLRTMLQIVWSAVHLHYLSTEFSYGMSIYKNFTNVRLWATTGAIPNDPDGNYQVRSEIADYAATHRPERTSPPKWWSAGT